MNNQPKIHYFFSKKLSSRRLNDRGFPLDYPKSNNNLSLEVPYEGAKSMYLVDTENPDEIEVLVNNVVNDLRG